MIGNYPVATCSLAFPALDFDRLNEVVQLALTQGQPATIKTLRARLRGTPDPKKQTGPG